MRLASISALFFAFSLSTVSITAQESRHFGNDTPRFDFSAGIQHLQANAPPGICECFGANGGYANLDWRFGKRIGLEGEFSGVHGSNISSLGQDLTLTTYLAGPHVTLPVHRVVLFYEALFGEAHGSDSYFPTGNSYTTSASSFAIAPGGGIDFDLNDRYSIRVIQARYLHSTLPNGTSNEQNQLQLGAGIVVHLGHTSRWASSKKGAPDVPPVPAVVAVAPPPPPAAPMVTDLRCTAAATAIEQGNPLSVIAVGQSAPADVALTYTWTTSGGNVLGSGTRVTVDTASLPAGEYHVTGRAFVGTDERSARECDVLFRVTVRPPPVPTRPEREAAFRAHVHDVYFDLNKFDLRPAAVHTVSDNAVYLVAHPEIRIQIGGYADQRGNAKYNLALGERRADRVKAALVAQGVAADRIAIVTFGHDAETCTAETEMCWQQNRRVGFVMQP